MRRKYMPGDECCPCICYKCLWLDDFDTGGLVLEVTIDGAGCASLNGTHITDDSHAGALTSNQEPCRFREGLGGIFIGTGPERSELIIDIGSGQVNFPISPVIHRLRISLDNRQGETGRSLKSWGWQSTTGFGTVINQTEILEALTDLCDGEAVELPTDTFPINTACDLTGATCTIALP